HSPQRIRLSLPSLALVNPIPRATNGTAAASGTASGIALGKTGATFTGAAGRTRGHVAAAVVANLVAGTAALGLMLLF
ncbi:MAG: hypothetical protein Q9175_003994, partial [Cornicularia normoerica]